MHQLHALSIPSTSQRQPTFNTHLMVIKLKTGIFKPKVYLIDTTCFPENMHVNIHQAMQFSCWQTTIHDELEALLCNHTWFLCSLPPSINTMDCKWLFKIQGSVSGKGFSQNVGLDFVDTFNLVVRANTIRIVLALVDVNNAFLNRKLTEEIYMTQSPKFEVAGVNGEKLVRHFHKALYGLCQAPRAWFHTLQMFLVDTLRFKPSKPDPSLFIRISTTSTLLLMAYVDDIVLTCTSNDEIDEVVKQLHNTFSLKDIGALHFVLGIEFYRTPTGLFLAQRKYVIELLT
ncbi:Retrovirus-related Pol polyprotein from transposon TNT 1-94 [Gossypium australe]|uniref:Retrovirus-related Pol polyprotein from transposon TNT 1-94 n=1 Tax=Gossypium australe TaxID=47621 RepID=A0A5B6UZM3_9ROSI|nr:Retrovirus-related Pol polyprotein from transposon TNT 1-94 [Gossypium australe]